MQPDITPNIDAESSDAYLIGVRGWLLVFVIIFFINALNILSLPFTIRLINWEVLWHESRMLTLFFAFSSIIEFVAAIVSVVIGALILLRRRAAVAAVNLFCLLICTESLAGLLMVDSIVELFDTNVPVINVAQYCKYISAFIRIDLGNILVASLYFAYAVVILAALLFFLYFHLSRRVKATLVNP